MSEFWFRPKERGIGAGVPLNWKGWALFAAYIGAILAVPSIYEAYLGYPGTILLRILGVVAISVPFLFVAWKKTEGGWRWRHGGEDADDENRA
jgi:hypothetical protein